MLTKVIIGGSLFTAAQAISMGVAPTKFAQTGTTAMNGCCCQVLPCMPTCMTQCEPEQPPMPPAVTGPLPPQMGEVILNLDVLLSHIMHTIHPEPMPTVPIPTDPEHEFTYIETVLTPVIIQLLGNDILPILPTCTYDDGSPFYLDAELVNPNATLPDPNEMLKGVLAA